MFPKFRPDTEQIAKTAYAAYGQATDGYNFKGDPLPEWDALPVAIRNAWQLAAEAVRHRVEQAQ